MTFRTLRMIHLYTVMLKKNIELQAIYFQDIKYGNHNNELRNCERDIDRRLLLSINDINWCD